MATRYEARGDGYACRHIRVDRESRRTRRSVLLVDDQAAFLEAARSILSGDARLAIVGTASSGQQALELLPELSPEIVLLDVQMPGMNGFEAAQAIRALAPATRIVLTSSDDDPVYAKNARRVGDGFVSKRSLSAQALLDLLDAV